MTAIAWATDIHLDCAKRREVDKFFDEIRHAKEESGAEILVVTGDISHYAILANDLYRLGNRSVLPVYFVIGNHDAYGSSIGAARERASQAARAHDNLFYLDNRAAVQLDDGVYLAGVNGWADARTGDFFISPMLLNDYHHVDDLRHIPVPQLLKEKLHNLGDENATRLGNVLATVPDTAEHVVVATHVPPWREACWHEGEISDNEWSPHFTCIAVGKEIERFAAERPDTRVTVLCGHTHGKGEAKTAPNLTCLTGEAWYMMPSICGVITVD